MTDGSHSYNQQWALGSKHSAPPSADSLSASQVVLESLRKRRGGETAQWMNKLAGEISLEPSATVSQQGLMQIQADLSPEDHKQHELVKWLDKLFSQFDLFASQFNRTAQGTDLLIACTAPSMNGQQPTEETPLSERIYEGHLVTRFWAMLLRGNAGRIDVFIIPAEMLLGFSLHKIDESIYSPLLAIESIWKDSELTWHIGGTCITRNQIPLLAKELFGDLVRVASGQMSESELFAHPLQEMNLGQNLAVGYNMPPSSAGASAVVPISELTNAAPPPAILPPSEFANAAPAPAIAPKTLSLNLASIDLAEKMMTTLDADTSLLSQLGKAALSADDATAFKKIELLAGKLETIKQPFKVSFTEIIQLARALQQTKEN